MPWWLWVILILMVLWLLGYWMGPQGGKSVTKRDQRILYSRGIEKITGPAAQPDIDSVAQGIVSIARQNHEHGMAPDPALIQAFEAMEKFERTKGDPNGLGGPFLLMIGGKLMEEGVLNVVHPDDIKRRWPDFGPHVLPDDPGAMVRLVGVNDLHVWPT